MISVMKQVSSVGGRLMFDAVSLKPERLPRTLRPNGNNTIPRDEMRSHSHAPSSILRPYYHVVFARRRRRAPIRKIFPSSRTQQGRVLHLFLFMSPADGGPWSRHAPLLARHMVLIRCGRSDASLITSLGRALADSGAFSRC